MTDARLTQEATAYLAAATTRDDAISQAAVLYLYQVTTFAAEIDASQAATVYLEEEIPDERVSQVAVLVLAYDHPTETQEAQIWSITRTDGQVFRFTSHDETVTFRGQLYYPCESLSATASSTGTAGDAGGDVTVMGFFSDDAIKETDLAFGLFDGALIEVWLVNWGSPTDSVPVRLAAGTLGKVTQGITGFKAEIRSPGARLAQQPLLQVVSPGCRYKLGDSKCKVDVEALRVSGAVTAIPERFAYRRDTYRRFYDSSRTEGSFLFNSGTITWVTGANAGQTVEVKNYDLPTGEIILWLPLPHEIAVGDTYTILPGCNLLFSTCKNTFNNVVNFGGFPDLPGVDNISQTANAKG